MPKFVLVYAGSGDMPDMSQMTPEQMQEGMAAWGAWYGSMGDALVDGGNPFGASTSVAPDGSAGASSTGLSGYTIVEAVDMAAAQEIAKGSPVLQNGIAVDVYQAIDMG